MAFSTEIQEYQGMKRKFVIPTEIELGRSKIAIIKIKVCFVPSFGSSNTVYCICTVQLVHQVSLEWTESCEYKTGCAVLISNIDVSNTRP